MPPTKPAPELEGIAKSIKDLDLLLRALLTPLPTSKPWQRQVRAHLVDADGLLQVLRISISMNRADSELFRDGPSLLASLRAANAYVAAYRADAGTKQAIQLGFSLAQRTVSGFEALTSVASQ